MAGFVSRHLSTLTALLIVSLSAACAAADGAGSATGPLLSTARHSVLPPGALVSVPNGTGLSEIWPYFTDDLATAQDPVNLVFTGQADPRAIRDALLGLTGDRTPVFPPVFPFTCTWSDAVGGLMAGFGDVAGWEGTAVQLQCGEYGPIRFHLRLVKLGAFTVGNGHFEVVIPGTTDHQVLSWELAEQLVTYDLARTGLLGAAPADGGAINAAPSHRAIPAIIYNALPVELKSLTGGPLGSVSAPVGIPSNGHPTVLQLGGTAPAAPLPSPQRFTLQFNQIIPRPFCAGGPADFLRVEGPVQLELQVENRPGGSLRRVFRADGELTAIPIDPATGLPSGPALQAKVSEWQQADAGDQGGEVKGVQQQQLIGPAGAEPGHLRIELKVASGKTPQFDRKVICP